MIQCPSNIEPHLDTADGRLMHQGVASGRGPDRVQAQPANRYPRLGQALTEIEYAQVGQFGRVVADL